MKGLLLALVCAASACAAPLDTDKVWRTMVQWEGYRTQPYRDQDGWSVGVGHALTMHAEPVKRIYTRAEVYRLFLRDYAVSLEACRAGVVGFDELPEDVRLIALQVAWTTGPSGFMAFAGFRRALGHHAYESALTELALSKWARQVQPARVREAIRVLRSH